MTISDPRQPTDPVDRWGSLADLGPALAIVVALPFVLVIGCGSLALGDGLGDFLLRNSLDRTDRRLLLGIAFALAGLSLLATLTLLGLRKLSVARLRSVARRLGPLLPLCLVPLLVHWEIWARRPMEFLLLSLALGWAFRRALQVALAEPPLSQWAAPGAWLASRSWARHVPLLLVVAGGLGYAIYFSYFTTLAHYNGHTRSYDLAIFDNLFWNIVHGGSFLESSPAMGPDGSHYGRHATLIAYLFAPLYALDPRAETLLIIQATLLGLAAIPLFAFARRRIGPAGATALAFLYLLYPPLHGSNLSDFHFLTLAPFFVFALVYAIESERRWLIVLTTVVTLAVREDVALAVAILGVWQILERRRARLGVILLAVGGAYFALTKFVLMPMAEGGSSFERIYQNLVPEGEQGLGWVVGTLLSNPFYGFVTMLTWQKLLYALQIMVPLLFLPLRRPLGILFVLPGLFLTLSSNHVPVISIAFQYTAFWTPYLFIACVVVLASQSSIDRRAWLAAILLTGIACSYQFGAILQRNTASGGFDSPYCFATTADDRMHREARGEIVALLPRDAAVAASETVVPHVSNRSRAYTLRNGIHDAEYILVALYENVAREQLRLKLPLRRGEFGVIEVNRDFALLGRGASTERNPQLYRRIFGKPMP